MNAINQRVSNKFGNKHLSAIIHGSLWSFSLKIASMMFGYISTMIISNYFGARTIGLVNLSTSTISIVSLFSLMGFPNAIIRFIGQYRDDRARISILKRMVFLSFIISLVFVFILFISADYIAISFFHDKRLKDFLQIMLIGTPFAIITTLLVEFIRGLQLIKYSETIRNLTPVFNLLFISFLVFILRFNDLTPAVASILSTIIIFLIATWFVTKKVKEIKHTSATPVSYKTILNTSFPMLITASMFMIMSVIDKLMLGVMTTTYEVGIYSVALKLATLTSMVLVAINTIVAPKFSELYWSNKQDDLRQVVRFSSKIIFLSSAPILGAYILFSHQILSFFGKEFIAGTSALIILSAGQFVNSASGSVGYFLEMTGNQNVFRNIVFCSSMLNIALNYLLIPHYGYNGAAIATALSMGLWNVSALMYVKNKFNLFMGYIPFVKLT